MGERPKPKWDREQVRRQIVVQAGRLAAWLRGLRWNRVVRRGLRLYTAAWTSLKQHPRRWVGSAAALLTAAFGLLLVAEWSDSPLTPIDEYAVDLEPADLEPIEPHEPAEGAFFARQSPADSQNGSGARTPDELPADDAGAVPAGPFLSPEGARTERVEPAAFEAPAGSDSTTQPAWLTGTIETGASPPPW